MLSLQKKLKARTTRAVRKLKVSPPVAQISYRGADGAGWRAELTSVTAGLFPGSINDPEFIHYRGDATVMDCQSPWIGYLAPDGSRWFSKCRCHTDPTTRLITFKFEHRQHSMEPGPSNRVSDQLCFLDWDGQSWIACVNSMASPGVPEFVLQRVA